LTFVIDFTKAKYILSAHLPEQLPPIQGTEVAFAGRSNVGKSSAINAITNQGNLAKTSKTPGRTQQINFFELTENYRLVDLPGYGYAKAPEHLRAHWSVFVSDYIATRESLVGLILPMDIRRPLTDLDVSMLQSCWETNLFVHILLTKADKFGRGKASNILQLVRNQMNDQPGTSVQLFSSLKKQGIEEARAKISELLQQADTEQ
jgi:GTP-binding protein